MTSTRVPAAELIQAAAGFVGDCQDAAFLVARDGTIVAWNTQATDLFGIPAWEASARKCAKVISGRSADGATLCSINCPLLAGAEPVPGPVAMRVRCGGSPDSARTVRVQHVPVKDPTRGATIAMVHIVEPDPDGLSSRSSP